MKLTQEVNEKIASLENRGYEKSINPNTKQINMRKSCQLQVLKFLSTDEDGAIKWTTRAGSDMQITLVECCLSGHPDFKVKATLNKSSWEQNPIEVGNTYSSVVQCVVTEKGTNALNPNVDNSYFTLFSSVGTVTSSASLANVGL